MGVLLGYQPAVCRVNEIEEVKLPLNPLSDRIPEANFRSTRRPRAGCPMLYEMHATQFKVSRRGVLAERALLDRIRGRAVRSASGALCLGIGDDCALLGVNPDEEIAVTTDLSIAGRHFRLDWHAPEVVGHRALARGLSDLAAMGARPIAAFLSLGLPEELTQSRGSRTGRAWVDRFYDGLLALADLRKTPLAGGDLAQSPIALADVVLIGAVPRGKALLRSGASVGDLLYVTGSLGGSATGLAYLAERPPTKSGKPRSIPGRMIHLLAAHLYPQPRITQGIWLRRRALATAAIDLSDGLSTDLAHLCAESGLAAEVDAAALPLHPAASLDQALNGGEDYELLFAASPKAKLPRKIAGVAVSCIGRLLPARRGRPQVTLLTPEGPRPLLPHGWEHFS